MFTPLNHVLALNSTLMAEYQDAYDIAAGNAWSKIIANETSGSGVAEIKEFLVEDLKIRVGLGTEYSDLKTASMTIVHDQASGGFEVRDRDFRSQNAIQIRTDAARGLGVKGALLGQELLLKLLNNANAKAYDGVAFFGTAHPINYKDATQGTYDTHATGRDLTNENLAWAAAQIENRVMPDGTPRNLKAKWLLHGPNLKFKAQLATGASIITSSANPVAKNSQFMAVKSDYDITPVQIPGLSQIGGKERWIVVGEKPGGGTFAKAFGISTLVPNSITNYDGITVPELQRAQMLQYLLTGDLAVFFGHPFLVQQCVCP